MERESEQSGVVEALDGLMKGNLISMRRIDQAKGVDTVTVV